MQNQHFRVFLMLPSSALEHLGGHFSNGWPNQLTTQVLTLEEIDLEMLPESLKWFIPHLIPSPPPAARLIICYLVVCADPR